MYIYVRYINKWRLMELLIVVDIAFLYDVSTDMLYVSAKLTVSNIAPTLWLNCGLVSETLSGGQLVSECW